MRPFSKSLVHAADPDGGDRSDPRWCRGSTGRIGEFGVIGAEQHDESYLDDREEEEEDGKLRFATDKLYGRQSEVGELVGGMMSMMQQEEEDGSGNTPHGRVALIAGYSGSGKSRLVEEFVKRISVFKPLFLSAKYSQQPSGQTFGAFGTLLDRVNESARTSLKALQDPLIEALGDDAAILSLIFPGLQTEEWGLQTTLSRVGSSGGLSQLSGNSGGGSSGGDDNGTKDGQDVLDASRRSVDSWGTRSRSSAGYGPHSCRKISKARMDFVLRCFLTMLCTRERPLVLFLDDLQWMDDQSQQFVQNYLLSAKIPHLFFVGAYRSNEVSEEHTLYKIIQEQKDPVPLCLELKELGMEDLNQFVADTLRLEADDALPLTKAIFTKTLGNPFYTQQALEQLVRKNAIYYDTMTFCWAWKLRQKELEELISDDIIEMVKNKIQQLDPELQHALVVASCTRSTVDLDTLLEVIHPDLATTRSEEEGQTYEEKYNLQRKRLLRLLQQACTQGLLLRETSNDAEYQYSFAHDRIEEAARSIIMEQYTTEEQEAFLTKIGKALHARADSPQGEDWMYFAAAKHLNPFATPEKPPDLQLALLNCRTAGLSAELLAFPAAIEFCKKGIQNLPTTNAWMTHYDLSLSLYTTVAEAEYGVGNSQQAEVYCLEILQHGNEEKIIDLLPAYQVYLDVLSGKTDMDEGKNKAMKVSFALLEKLGYSYPKSESMQKLQAWNMLKKVKAKYIPTKESIADMPHISDPAQVAVFDILSKAGTFAFQTCNVHLYVLTSCEALKWMHKNGLTDGSPAVIASFSNSLMHQYGDFETSPSVAELAILITDRLKNKFHETRALNTANQYVLGWVRPLRSCLKYHQRAIQSGIVSGNTEGSTVGRMYASWNMFYSGSSLVELEAFCRESAPICLKAKMMFDYFLTSMVWQASLNLLGSSGQTTVLVGEGMDENSPPYSGGPLHGVVNVWKRYLFVFFGDWEEGTKLSLDAGDSWGKGPSKGMMYGMEALVRGILLTGMARKSNQSKHKKPAQQILKQCQDLVQKGCVNLAGPTRLMEAEHAVLAGKHHKAGPAFEEAIVACKEGEFHQFAGLANERYAEYLLEIGESKLGQDHIAQAIDCYRLWGAKKKVELLENFDFNAMADRTESWHGNMSSRSFSGGR